ncbi:MAG: CoA transferase [Chloroflexi bacterium]|nr:CoA transferase [Chloroflexota bacterium]MCI0782172.1 CoA transferase [Chloroflexota bacterium]MCI0786982.1 CoA transferase [Chloroflexota bacterium]MCI0795131.1 CoA transferase [Chloroflexota bacterium]MCI0799270.1 CoA transferase [Chloroflexota bacterium]
MSGQVDRIVGPLDGMRVIDWTMWQFGPVSTMMLADMGAEVIKVESLDGDHGRQVGRSVGIDSRLPQGLSAFFEGLNRQKLGIAVNLKTPEGLEIMYKLVAKSDIFVENFRKGVAERLGLGYEDLIKYNEKIIYASASGYGPKGPDAGKPAFALTAEARAGALWWFGPPDDTPHQLDIADQSAAIMLSYGIVGAIVARERFGFGQKVDVSHLGSMIWARGMQNQISLLVDQEYTRFDQKRPGNVLWNYYKCKDGQWIAFSMGQDRYWPPFCRAIGRTDFIEDTRFNTSEARYENREGLVKLLDEIFISKTRDEWERSLRGNDEIIWEMVQRNLDLPRDPQVVANEYIVDYDHPVIGPSKWLQTPVTYSRTPLSTRKMAPALGENTEETLTELLGYTWDEIVALKDKNVIL